MSKFRQTIKSLFGSNKASDRDLRNWARIEYGTNWEIAYEYMRKNPGKQLPTVNQLEGGK